MNCPDSSVSTLALNVVTGALFLIDTSTFGRGNSFHANVPTIVPVPETCPGSGVYVGVGTSVGVLAGTVVGVWVVVAVGVAVCVGVAVGEGVAVAVDVDVGVAVGRGVAVAVDITVGVAVGGGVAAAVGVDVDVSVGDMRAERALVAVTASVVLRATKGLPVGVCKTTCVAPGVDVGSLSFHLSRNTTLASSANITTPPTTQAQAGSSRADAKKGRVEPRICVLACSANRASRSREAKMLAVAKRSAGVLESILSSAAAAGLGRSGRRERGGGTGLCSCALRVPGVLPGKGTRPVSM
jgi:hypothetical protein